MWKDVEVTAVEMNPDIAAIYQDFFPDDTVIVGDAHQYLLDHFKEFDFIWSSPPCPTHSDIRRMGVDYGQYEALYPDMGLYQEIILLQTFFKGQYCVENVKPYYEPLIPYQFKGRHCLWSNFAISEFNLIKPKHHEPINKQEEITGFNLSSYKNIDKRKILRNCVESELGKHILDCATSRSLF